MVEAHVGQAGVSKWLLGLFALRHRLSQLSQLVSVGVRHEAFGRFGNSFGSVHEAHHALVGCRREDKTFRSLEARHVQAQ